MTRIYKQAVQAVLLYGMNCVFQNKKSIQLLDTAQENFLKAAIGIYNSCRTTPLPGGLEIHTIHKHIRIQELGVLKSVVRSTSMTRSFYTYLIDCLFAGNCGKGKTLLHRVLATCEEQSIPFVQYKQSIPFV